MQRLGQHFLKNKTVLQTIVEAIDIKNGDKIIEIGAGHGELTIPLLRASEKLDCAITSIEKDRELVPGLALLSKKEKEGRLTIIEGDALKVLTTLAAENPNSRTKASPYKVVGNIPYYITGKLLRVISELEKKPTTTILLIQKEVALRICAVPPEMNRLAASVQFWADAKILASVPRKDFAPSPDVDSAVILLALREIPASTNSMQYYRAVRGIFSQPRKTLLNNAWAMAGELYSKEQVTDKLKKLAIDPEGRPQDVTVDQICAIGKTLWG
jgi:16S rRNA (adenine1518-N6/adenine1519-N6)-dimethyltransferase